MPWSREGSCRWENCRAKQEFHRSKLFVGGGDKRVEGTVASAHVAGEARADEYCGGNEPWKQWNAYL